MAGTRSQLQMITPQITKNPGVCLQVSPRKKDEAYEAEQRVTTVRLWDGDNMPMLSAMNKVSDRQARNPG